MVNRNLSKDLSEQVLAGLQAYWNSSDCQDELDSFSLCTDAALLSAKKEQAVKPMCIGAATRRALLRAFVVLSRCDDRHNYHEHWFQLGYLLDAAAAAVCNNNGTLADTDAITLATTVYMMSSKMRHGEKSDEIVAVTEYIRDVLDIIEDGHNISFDDVNFMETKVLNALSWKLPMCSGFTTLAFLFSRLAVFTQHTLEDFGVAWDVAFHASKDLAIAGRTDFEVILGAFLMGLLKERRLSLKDIMVVPEPEMSAHAAATGFLGAADVRPRYYLCVQQASLSTKKELQAALSSALYCLVNARREEGTI
jgi:hypothetical protein